MNDIAAAERAVLGTLIESNGQTPLPPALASLVANAPESFGDLRNAAIAAAIKDLKANNRAVHAEAVLERLDFTDCTRYLMETVSAALPLPVAELEADTIWQGYRQRRTLSLFTDASQALTKSPNLARAIVNNVRSVLTRLDDEPSKDGLPDITDGAALLAQEPVLPEILIEGLLYKGSKMSLGGASKAYKSWTFLNIALSLSTGADWLNYPCRRARVLYVNLEIQPGFLHKRLETLCLARLLFPEPGWLDIWNLRGFSAPHTTLIPKIIKRTRELGYGLVIIDPIYKIYSVGSDENSSADIGFLMNSVDSIATQTGASIAFGAHFAKGNAAQKEAIDRVSGSGVYARDPDTVLTFTKHEVEDCFTIEVAHRNLPPETAFVVKWEFPQFTRQSQLDPAKLKTPKSGRPTKFSENDLLNLIQNNPPMTTKELRTRAGEELGMKPTNFYDILRSLADAYKITKDTRNTRWSVIQTPVDNKPYTD